MESWWLENSNWLSSEESNARGRVYRSDQLPGVSEEGGRRGPTPAGGVEVRGGQPGQDEADGGILPFGSNSTQEGRETTKPHL